MNVLKDVQSFFRSSPGEKRVIGRSFFGREIYAIKLGHGAPAGIVQYAMHGREFITSYLAFEHFRRGGVCGSVWFVPLANPDGAMLSAKGLVSEHKIIVDPSRKIDERPSAGIICTYGDQAGLIKKKRKGYQFTGFSGKPDEKLVISTVDDFQGDERDIIIVSMVRNPSGIRYDAEFIKKFERINVALSRARKLLIIVGSKKFLSEAGIIDLPDLEGDHSRDKINFPVYREIIDTINFRGRILTAKDILGE